MGHHTSLWNPGNARYLYGTRQGIHVIALEATASYLRRAARVVDEVCFRGGLVLFVGTRQGQMRAVVNAARLAKGCHLFTRWTPGTLTNGNTLLRGLPTKMVDHLDRDVAGLEHLSEDRKALQPDLVVCLNPMENWVLLRECCLVGVPTIGVIDTDMDPSMVTYPIPANDDR